MGLSYGTNSFNNGLIFTFDPANSKCNASSNPMNDAVTGNSYSRTGSPTLGPYGGSSVDVYRFTTTNQYFESGVLNTQPATNLTIEAWIYADSSEISSGDRGTIVRLNGGSSAYLSWNKSNRKLSNYWYSHSPDGYHELLPSMNRNQWYHVVSVWDNAAGVLRQYQNSTGVRDSASTSTVGNASTGANVEIGMESTGRQFAGAIGSVRIYNIALTQNQVMQNYYNFSLRYGTQ